MTGPALLQAVGLTKRYRLPRTELLAPAPRRVKGRREPAGAAARLR